MKFTIFVFSLRMLCVTSFSVVPLLSTVRTLGLSLVANAGPAKSAAEDLELTLKVINDFDVNLQGQEAPAPAPAKAAEPEPVKIEG